MKKNGFTLIELIATIGLLGMLATILINLSIKKINESKEIARDTMFESIELAAANYVTENSSDLESLKKNDYIYIPLQTLVEKEYFTKSLIDPTTEKALPITNYVYVTRDYNGNINAYYDSEQREKIKIELIGQYNVYVKVGKTYEEKGIKATLPDGTDETDYVEIDGTVNTNTPGKYLIKYIYDDRYITRNVIVYDGELPSGDFISYYKLIVDLDGGTTTQKFETAYAKNTKITLTAPKKAYHTFLGWQIESGNGTLNGNVLTTGNKPTRIRATYIDSTILTSYTCNNISAGSSPYMMSYTGDCEVIDDSNDNWRVKFLTSGTLTLDSDVLADAFLVGGGGGGGNGVYAQSYSSGGGGGYTKTENDITLKSGIPYEITIGAGGEPGKDGGTTFAFDFSAEGGKTGTTSKGGDGGSGGGGSGRGSSAVPAGKGGEAGGNGVPSSGSGGNGQLVTTREFGEETGDLYASGGGGGSYSLVGSGGSSGGGSGAAGGSTKAKSGTENTGGGGGGGGALGQSVTSGGSGGSGIVVIRNHREPTEIVVNGKVIGTYSGTFEVNDDGNENWKVKFLSTGRFIPSKNINVDAFLVGGGGGGGNANFGQSYSSGGGGGYTRTENNITLNSGVLYEVTIGYGGSPGSDGGTTSAFNFSAEGGKTGTSSAGGTGGSGGGGAGASSVSYPPGKGGENGENGVSSSGSGGKGQVSTVGPNGETGNTREFGEETGNLYAGGGGGGGGDTIASGGSGGGGTGGGIGKNSVAGVTNTGGGGGGGGAAAAGGYPLFGAKGGSGIVIIRNTR